MIGITSPTIACKMPNSFEPSAETVGTSDINVRSTIPVTMIAMIEIGRMRLP